jgi:hypothetical protein
MSDQPNAWERWKANLGETRPWDMLNPEAPKVSLEISEKRLSICKSCPELIPVTNQCKKCGCIMHLKTKLEKATCPLGKW